MATMDPEVADVLNAYRRKCALLESKITRLEAEISQSKTVIDRLTSRLYTLLRISRISTPKNIGTRTFESTCAIVHLLRR